MGHHRRLTLPARSAAYETAHLCYNIGMENKPIPWRLDAGQIEVVDEAVAAILRRKTPAERIALAADAHRTARAMLTAQIRSRHPEWTDGQVQTEVARRLTRGAN